MIKNNGMNPTWDETFELSLSCPHLATLLFQVHDENIGVRANKTVGFCAIPAMCLREGYRAIPILNNQTAQREDEFQLKQTYLRANIRVKEGRAKAIDMVAQNLELLVGQVEPEDALEMQLQEPLAIFWAP